MQLRPSLFFLVLAACGATLALTSADQSCDAGAPGVLCDEVTKDTEADYERREVPQRTDYKQRKVPQRTDYKQRKVPQRTDYKQRKVPQRIDRLAALKKVILLLKTSLNIWRSNLFDNELADIAVDMTAQLAFCVRRQVFEHYAFGRDLESLLPLLQDLARLAESLESKSDQEILSGIVYRYAELVFEHLSALGCRHCPYDLDLTDRELLYPHAFELVSRIEGYFETILDFLGSSQSETRTEDHVALQKLMELVSCMYERQSTTAYASAILCSTSLADYNDYEKGRLYIIKEFELKEISSALTDYQHLINDKDDDDDDDDFDDDDEEDDTCTPTAIAPKSLSYSDRIKLIKFAQQHREEISSKINK